MGVALVVLSAVYTLHPVTASLSVLTAASLNDTATSEELRAAVARDDVVAIDRMVSRGADINGTTADGGSLLHVAAENGCLEAARRLLELGVPRDGVDAAGQSPLWLASGRGDVAMLGLLSASGADLRARGGWWRRSLVHAAAQQGKDEALGWLLDQGLGADGQDTGGWTPLHLAAAEGRTSTVHLLLARGANASIADNDRDIPTHEAARKGHLEVVRLLVNVTDVNARNGAGVSPLILAAGRGHEPVVALLLASGARVNMKTSEDWTALHEGCYNGSAGVVVRLLGAGAEVDAKDKDGWTPLFVAAARGLTLVVQILTDRGANIRATAKNGATPLHEAASRGHRDTVLELLQRRAPVNARTEDGRTPLKMASTREYHAVMELLRSKGGVI